MKRTALALILATGLTATPATAQEQHEHGAQAVAQQQDHAGHTMQDSDAMAAHREKMAEMRALMQQAHAAHDDDARYDEADGGSPEHGARRLGDGSRALARA